jgi:hypothetical protein
VTTIDSTDFNRSQHAGYGTAEKNFLSRVPKAAYVAFVGLFFWAVAAIAMLAPERDWDMAAYVALAIQEPGMKADELHAKTWEIVRAKTTEKEFVELTQAGAYRQAQFSNAQNFVSQLPMYSVKVGYVTVLRALSPWLGPTRAIATINAFSVLLLGFCAYLALRMVGDFRGAVFMAPILMISSLTYMARLATPDMLVAALTVAGTLAFCARRPWLAAPILVAAFLVRPDTLIYLFALVLATQVFCWQRIPALLTFGAAALMTFPIAGASDHIGWWPHFWFSTVEMQPSMDGFVPDFSAAIYLKGLALGAAKSLIAHQWVAVGALLLAFAGLLLGRDQRLPTYVGVPMLAAFLAVGGRFLVFPLPDDRIYAVNLWIFAACVLELWRLQSGSRRNMPARPQAR